MKKVFFTLLVACIATCLWAKEMPKSGLGVQIGWAQPILRLNDAVLLPKDSLMNVTKLNGFKVGVVYDASFIKGFGSSVGLNYTLAGNSGTWLKTGILGEYPRSRTSTLYQELELFVDWQYKFEVAKETYLILYTGPSLQCGLDYTKKTVLQAQLITGDVLTTSTTDNKYTTSSSDELLTRLNVTWGIGAGFQYKQYFLRGGYDFGLLNPYKEKQFSGSDRYTRGRLDQWSIKIGMYLWYR
ncbi:MAG: outer membrane beta-barrel protein [Paludibacteraceae bacterium]|nr:outer membrane beta-barrel protein [Paludibacteraceae bacterium]